MVWIQKMSETVRAREGGRGVQLSLLQRLFVRCYQYKWLDLLQCVLQHCVPWLIPICLSIQGDQVSEAVECFSLPVGDWISVLVSNHILDPVNLYVRWCYTPASVLAIASIPVWNERLAGEPSKQPPVSVWLLLDPQLVSPELLGRVVILCHYIGCAFRSFSVELSIELVR